MWLDEASNPVVAVSLRHVRMRSLARMLTSWLSSFRPGRAAGRTGDILGHPAIYGEAAFKAFLAVEQERSHRSGLPLVLVLVELLGEGGPEVVTIDEATAAGMFEGMAGALRETDFVGWYEHGRVVGAVLTELSSSEAKAGSLAAVTERIMQGLSLRVGEDRRHRMRIRASNLLVEGEVRA